MATSYTVSLRKNLLLETVAAEVPGYLLDQDDERGRGWAVLIILRL